MEIFLEKLKDTNDPETNENLLILNEIQKKINQKEIELKGKKKKITGNNLLGFTSRL